MPALALTGITVPVLATAGQHPAPTIIGSKTRSANGTLIGDIRSKKENLKGRTTPVSQEEMLALQGLILGEGFSWSFDTNLASDKKGLYATAGYGSLSVVASGKYGSRLKVLDAQAVLPVALPSSGSTVLRGTAFYWRYDTDRASPAWVHNIAVFSTTTGAATSFYRAGVAASDDHSSQVGSGSLLLLDEPSRYELVNGGTQNGTYAGGALLAPGDSVTATVGGVVYLYILQAGGGGTTSGSGTPGATWHSTFVDSGAGTFLNVGQAAAYFDDLVVVPYVIPESWPDDIYAEHNARAWTALPTLRVTGDIVPNAPLTMEGELGDGQLMIASLPGDGLANNVEAFEFTLSEV